MCTQLREVNAGSSWKFFTVQKEITTKNANGATKNTSCQIRGGSSSGLVAPPV